MIRAALLDKDGIYLRMDELESAAQASDRHVLSITECDLPPGRYKWCPGQTTFNPFTGRTEPNPYGGRFIAIEFLGMRKEEK